MSVTVTGCISTQRLALAEAQVLAPHAQPQHEDTIRCLTPENPRLT